MNSRPNILFIIADDHRHSAISSMGDPTVQTPVLDALVARGTTFRRAHIMGGLSGAVCVPTRAAVHSGVNFFRAWRGAKEVETRNHLTIDPSLPLLGQTLRQAGYRTFGTGKWHNDKAAFSSCFGEGANIFFGGMCDHDKVPLHDFDSSGEYAEEAAYTANGFSTELFCDAAIRFLKENPKDEQPFFLYLALTSPHDPRMAPMPFANMYDPDDIPLPPNFMAEHPFDNGDMYLRDEVLAGFPRTAAEVQQHIADYYAMISHHDYCLGLLFDALNDNGNANDTIIVYTADHGLGVGQHGLLGKQNMYDHSVRIPLIFAGPTIPMDRRADPLVYQIDIYPTVCDLANVPIPESVEGKSLVPPLGNARAEHRPFVCSAYRDTQRMVSDGNWKLIRYAKSAITNAGSERTQLFHLATDPWELHDLSQDPNQQQRIRRMTTLLNAWQHEVDDPWAGTF